MELLIAKSTPAWVATKRLKIGHTLHMVKEEYPSLVAELVLNLSQAALLTPMTRMPIFIDTKWVIFY